MKLLEGMEVTINSGDVGIYVGNSIVDFNHDGCTFAVMYSGGELVYARGDALEIIPSPYNQQLIKFAVEKLRHEVALIEWEIYELEAEERYDD